MTVAAIIAHQARFLCLPFWRDYVTTMRPYLLFVSGVTGIAGVSLGPTVSPAAAVVLSVVFFLAYGFGQALTDCFQTDTDSLSAPYRPLVRGTLLPQDVLVVSLGGLTVSAVIVVWFNPVNVLAAGLTVFGLATYTWFKRRWWAGPWYNAWIVSLLVLIGYQCASGGAGGMDAPRPALYGTMLAALAAYANFVLTGYYKDIAADRATGYKTLPVVFGRRASAWVSDGLATLAFVGAGIGVSGARGVQVLAATGFLAGAAVFATVAQWRLHGIRTDEEAHRAIEPVVHSYILLLCGIAAAHKPTWAVLLVGFYLAFVWTARHRPMMAQI